VVSAKDRTIGAGPYDAFIQTRRLDQPGHSGGPSSTRAAKSWDQLRDHRLRAGDRLRDPDQHGEDGSWSSCREKGSVTRGWARREVQALTRSCADSLRLSAEGGPLIAGVIKGEDPADKPAQGRDVIVEFDGRTVRSDRELVLDRRQHRGRKKVSVKVLRDARTWHSR